MHKCDGKLLRITLTRSGLSHSDLAKQIGFSRSSVSNVLCNNSGSCPVRLKIESVLGPIWSTSEEHERRIQLTRHLGFDPYLAGIFELRKKAGELKIHGRSKHLHKQALIDFLAEHYLSEHSRPKRQDKKLSGKSFTPEL